MRDTLIIRKLGILPYSYVLDKMHHFINHRNIYSFDEIWFLEHTKTFTYGKSDKQKYCLNYLKIPIIKSDRGGKITYHGPGQQIMYVLLNLRRRNMNIRNLVQTLENIVISTLSHFSIHGIVKNNMPGVYVEEKKICSIALAVKNGFCFHGVALNVNMDLSPFTYIDPCGYPELKMIQISDLHIRINIADVQFILIQESLKHFQITSHIIKSTFV